ncbi:three-Cys-motif partner protein TcmP, partial [Pseudomonas aeruginosa]|uniref:three-Cys-motif partner protein TcmP n=7 Tax=Pseudomonas TaxID=286 RepID=UPI000EB3F07A
CLLILNDNEKPVVELLKQNVTPVLMESVQSNDHLTIRVEYLCTEFEKAYPEIKAFLQHYRIANVVFNLDQCGHSHVAKETLVDITNSYTSAEVFYTFMIDSLLAFLQRDNPKALESTLAYLSLSRYDLDALSELMHKKRWLGAAEKIVYTNFQRCAQYVSPFSINNPGGWRYWLIHLANSYRARQVYNNVLHDNSKSQAHCGRSGLNMLAHDPEEEEKLTLYLFDSSAREEAKVQLLEDIPRVISEFGDALNVGDFYSRIYNHTPAHSDDIHIAMLENPDIEVVTKAGGVRRKPGQINIFDTIKLKSQKSFFFPFSIKK